MGTLYFFVFILLVNAINEVRSDCEISLKNDYKSTTPVFIRRNGDYLGPDMNGKIIVTNAEYLRAACPGDSQQNIILGGYATGTKDLEVRCINNKFTVASTRTWAGNFTQILCKKKPAAALKETDRNCATNGVIHRAGYIVNDNMNAIYEICFDSNLNRAFYSKHTLQPTSHHFQGGMTRPTNFCAGSIFNKEKIAKLYTEAEQRRRLRQILGSVADKYTSDSMIRGHLTPNADFSMGVERCATFFLANVLPQWQSVNGGSCWSKLEQDLKAHIFNQKKSVEVYTGGFNVLNLPGFNETSIYLGVDSQNKAIIPVPMYFYKLVYDAPMQAAVVFLVVNNRFYDNKTLNYLEFCNKNICSQYQWLNWQARSNPRTFCCDYDEFRAVVKDLPPLTVTRLFQ